MINHSKPWIDKNDCLAAMSVMKSGMISGGNKVAKFEEALIKYLGLSGAIVVNSGTEAIVLALKVLEIKPKDEVILSAYVCHNVVDAIVRLGAKPVFCDIGLDWNVTVETVLPKVSSKTKAIIAVHIFGIPVDIDSLRRFKVPIIENFAQAFGLNIKGKMAGSLSDIGVCSFHATKCLTTGEGGVLVSNSNKLLKTAHDLCIKKEVSSSMADVQAAIGISQLKRYKKMLQIRRNIATKYLKELPWYLTDRMRKLKENSIFFRFLVNNNEPFEKVCLAFEKHGVMVRRGVDELLHRRFNIPDKQFPGAVNLFNTTLSLPIYPALTENEQIRVIKACKEIFKK